MVGCSQQSASKAAKAQSAPKSASEASVVEMPAYLDVQANPDKYVGRKVSWIRTETMTLIVDAHGEQVEREFAWRDNHGELSILNSFRVAGSVKETEAAKATKKNPRFDFLVFGTVKGGVQVAPLPGLRVPPGVFVPVPVDATIDAVPRR
jgi:hypothetical protein